jgi:fumarate reductase subunit C
MRQPLDVLDAERLGAGAPARAARGSAARRELLWELVSGGTGLALTVYLWIHLFDVGSLLFGPAAFDRLAEFFEHNYIAQPVVILVSLLFFVHALAAARKIPARMAERRRFNRLSRELARSQRSWRAGEGREQPHADSWLWVWQVRTGMLILLMGSFHIGLAVLDTFTDLWGTRVGMEAATTMQRVAAGLSWFYLVFLLLLAVHASAGVYRLALKWGVGARHSRAALKRSMTFFGLAFFLVCVIVLAVMAAWVPAPFVAGGP